jgi:two-component system, OmpR family, sensor kinase
MSLRDRLLVGMAVIAVVLGLAAAVVASTTEGHLVDQVDADLRAVPRPQGPADLRAILAQRGQGEQRFSSLYVAVVEPGGSVDTLFAPDVRAEVPLPDVDGREAIEAAAAGTGPYTIGSRDGEVRYRALAVRAPGVVLVFALPLSGIDTAVGRLVGVELMATVAVLAVLALVTWWVMHLGVRPIRRMTETAGLIAAGDLSQRVPDVGRGTEAGELGDALNRMLGHIEEAFEQRRRSEDRLRQFVGDASHELRTPITTIRGYAELYRAGALDDPDELREAMRRTEQEAVRMGALVDDLLHLARLDQGRPLERVPVDLAAVVADVVRDARAVEPERSIGAEVDGPVTVTGDDGRLRQVAANLVRNALVHTDPPASVTVRLRREGDRAVLDVVDDGPGMPPEVAARAFERFFRADPARARHRGGSGLGLAIVDATVAAHGGTVGILTAPGAGTTVRVDLPATDPVE